MYHWIMAITWWKLKVIFIDTKLECLITLLFFTDAVKIDLKIDEEMNDSVIVEVNITNSSVVYSYLDRLVWYCNEYPIFSSNISLLEQNKSFKASFCKVGEYRVRYEGLLTVPDNTKCENALLDALQF